LLRARVNVKLSGGAAAAYERRTRRSVARASFLMMQ